ncbi:class I SAM-dependent methyltransferase family protein [Candidatus Bathyarchaeota archaeon]|nr:class I SAM-dependent methyltransferase family protein [Candidatus Bathyarchaeota archaeon]
MRKKLMDCSTNNLKGVYNSFDVIGEIAVIKLPRDSACNAGKIASTILRTHRNVKTVLAQESPIAGEYRLRNLSLVKGENKTTALYRESHCLFEVDLAKCYFSPRLSYERTRIAKLVENHEVVLNMFAGVGCFSIIIAKQVNGSKVISIDKNPVAHYYMARNVRLNSLYGKVIPLLGDAKKVIQARLKHIANRILMPLPGKAFEYLPYALSALSKKGGYLHYYDFQHAAKNENPTNWVTQKVTKKLSRLNVKFEVISSRVVRSTGPNWHQIVLDLYVEPLRQVI